MVVPAYAGMTMVVPAYAGMTMVNVPICTGMTRWGYSSSNGLFQPSWWKGLWRSLLTGGPTGTPGLPGGVEVISKDTLVSISIRVMVGSMYLGFLDARVFIIGSIFYMSIVVGLE